MNKQVSSVSCRGLYVAVLETRNYIVGEANAPSGLYIQGRTPGTWRHAGWHNLRCTAVAAMPDALFLGAGNGVLRSRDGGATWRVTTDWRVTEVLDLVIDPFETDALVAATAYGLWRSPDAGETWEPLPAAGSQTDATFVSSLVLDIQHQDRMVIGTEAGLFVSDAGGEAWRAVGPRVPVRALSQSPASPAMWLAGTAGHGALVSFDGGEGWVTTAGRETLYAVAIDPVQPQRMAVGGYRTGVHLSTDGGQSWQRSTHTGTDPSIHALAFDPDHAGRLWIGTVGDGVFCSDDGRTWQDAGLPETTVYAFTFA